jgi:hypothetical protein
MDTRSRKKWAFGMEDNVNIRYFFLYFRVSFILFNEIIKEDKNMKNIIKTLRGLFDIFEDRDDSRDVIKYGDVVEEFARMNSVIDF